MDKEKNQETGSEGFSEKELDLDIEIRAGEWQNLKKFNTYQKDRARENNRNIPSSIKSIESVSWDVLQVCKRQS